MGAMKKLAIRLKEMKMKANYGTKVRFTKTGQYGCGSENEDDVYTIEEFKTYCKRRMFIDYDGFGHPVKDKKSDETIDIVPSRIEDIPEDATHIVWFNR